MLRHKIKLKTVRRKVSNKEVKLQKLPKLSQINSTPAFLNVNQDGKLGSHLLESTSNLQDPFQGSHLESSEENKTDQ
jgi:hypothetical protein